MVAGYFDPDYGDIYPRENAEETISKMLKNRDKVPGGVVMVPLVKFGLFDTDLETNIFEADGNVQRVHLHLEKWKKFLSETGRDGAHAVRISHTDQDMLTVTFQVKFQKPTRLDRNELMEELFPTLDLLQRSGLL